MSRPRPPVEKLQAAADWHDQAKQAGEKIDAAMKHFAQINGVTKSRAYEWRRWFLKWIYKHNDRRSDRDRRKENNSAEIERRTQKRREEK